MKILIVNDDGARCEGLHALMRALKDDHELTVVVPEVEQSGKSHSMTYFDPLYYFKIHISEVDHDAYVVKGTPGDYVLMALDQICDGKPDLLLSGINRGYNTGNTIVYSGTVSAAYEGANRGIPSIALSTGFMDVDFDDAANIFKQMLPYFAKEEGLFFYNVNIPGCKPAEIKGIKKTFIDSVVPEECMEKRIDPFERDYYWHSYTVHNIKEYVFDEGSDVDVVEKKYISVTPLKYDFLDRKKLETMDEFIAGFSGALGKIKELK